MYEVYISGSFAKVFHRDGSLLGFAEHSNSGVTFYALSYPCAYKADTLMDAVKLSVFGD